jgi:ArsR family transcriptional regulator, arsenate/arsenite/antimonite-responsive transcriptional repressor
MQSADLLKAFSEPIRLRILHLLANRGPELCVCDLVDVLAVPQGTVSRHLMQLRQLDLVNDRRVGNWMHYSLGNASSELHQTLLKCLTSCFAAEKELQSDLHRFDVLRSKRKLTCCDAVDCCEPRPRVRTNTVGTK